MAEGFNIQRIDQCQNQAVTPANPARKSLKRRASSYIKDRASSPASKRPIPGTSRDDSMKAIQQELLSLEPKRRPLAEPPIFRYSLFEGFETLQKEAKSSPSISCSELAWITGYVDLQSEIDLLYQYENSIWGTVRENASEGMNFDNDFLIGLAREVWEDAKTVQEERMGLQRRHEKSWEEVLELHYLVRYGRDREGNVKWPFTEEVGLEEWLKGYDGWGFKEQKDLMKVRLGIKGMVLP